MLEVPKVLQVPEVLVPKVLQVPEVPVPKVLQVPEVPVLQHDRHPLAPAPSGTLAQHLPHRQHL